MGESKLQDNRLDEALELASEAIDAEALNVLMAMSGDRFSRFCRFLENWKQKHASTGKVN